MPSVGKLTDLDDAVLTVVYYSRPESLTYAQIRKELKNRGFDVSIKEVEASVTNLRDLDYFATKIEGI